jgi:hypothetical protein
MNPEYRFIIFNLISFFTQILDPDISFFLGM